MSKKTDLGKIEYPKGTSAGNRRLCRSIINEVSNHISDYDIVVVACSGGIDSTVLVHAVSQALIIQPYSKISGKEIQSTAVYVNHNFRPDEVQKEIDHVENISYKYMSFSTEHIELNLSHVKSNIQAEARKYRYNALNEYCTYLASEGDRVALLTAHQANDVAETRLFEFIKGKVVRGIHPMIPQSYGAIVRPMLKFSRDQIEEYAHTFNLTWCEDSSNKKNVYARNIIRNELIPIAQKINPGIIRCLSREVA